MSAMINDHWWSVFIAISMIIDHTWSVFLAISMIIDHTWSVFINDHSWSYDHWSYMIGVHRCGYEHWSSMIIDNTDSCMNMLFMLWKSIGYDMLIIAMNRECWSCMITYIIMSSWTLSWTLWRGRHNPLICEIIIIITMMMMIN